MSETDLRALAKELAEADIRVDGYRAGDYVALKMTHLPTGISVSTDGRNISQHEWRRQALEEIATAIRQAGEKK